MAKFFQEWNEYAVKHVPSEHHLIVAIVVTVIGTLATGLFAWLSVFTLTLTLGTPEWYWGVIFAVVTVGLAVLVTVFSVISWKRYKRAKKYEKERGESGQG